MDKKIAIFPGSFDPITLGHLDIIERSCQLFDEVIVLVAVNHSKQTLFTLTERLNLIRQVVAPYQNARVDCLESGLLVDYFKNQKATVIVRGVRNSMDVEYEAMIAIANQQQNSQVDTIFFYTKNDYRHISSSLVKEIAKCHGDLTQIVPMPVQKALENKYCV